MEKKLYIKFAKICGLYNNLTWQASSLFEAQEIKNIFGQATNVVIAPELIQQNELQTKIRHAPKKQNNLRIIFLSRISPKKNLFYVLETLFKLQGNFALDIYGPIEDEIYWQKCQTSANNLSANITVTYKGEINNDQVVATFSQYDLFFFPTLNENYGYVIIESLLAGCPVLISDQTPWQDLEKFGAGSCFNLNEPQKFVGKLQEWLAMDESMQQQHRENAYQYAIAKTTCQNTLSQNLMLFS